MHDVRMQGFARRHTVAAALSWLDSRLRTLEPEEVSLREAAGRVLATAITSDLDIPGFDRATMDGYAVVADSTEGATPYNRVSLTVVGDALPGAPFSGAIGHGQAVRIMTGAPMPNGGDAVLPAESAEIDHAAANRIMAVATVSPAKNVGHRGEDIVAGTTVVAAGRVLRPQDVGVISSIGLDRVSVIRRPHVRLVITGNELLPSGSRPRGFHITDANGPMLAALAERDGAVVEFPGLVADDADAIAAALLGPLGSFDEAPTAARDCGSSRQPDIVIVSGGSSVGIEDLAPTLLATHGTLAVHGIAMRPSSPTGMGVIGQRLVFLLPGNPVSALCAYDFFAGRAIRVAGGRSKEWPYLRVQATLTRKISSPIGRLDYARVRVHPSAGLGAGPSAGLGAGPSAGLGAGPSAGLGAGPSAGLGAGPSAGLGAGPSTTGTSFRAEPLSIGGASVLSSTTRADGFVIVGDDSEGFPAGADVDVWLYG